jgi:type IV secretory pathway VirB10-like protein
MATADVIEEQDEQGQEHLGGGRFNRLLGAVFVAIAMLGGVALALGVQSSGIGQSSASQKSADDPGSAARDRGEIEDLAAHGAEPHAAPTVMPNEPVMPISQPPVQPRVPKPPSRYAQWADEKYMKALESPEMVQAFHSGGTLEIASASRQQSDSYTSGDQTNPTISVHPAASPYTVMAGSILPAVLISGINSDLPGPILAQVSQNVLDSATGRSILIPQGSRLIGAYQNASTYGQQRVQIAWQRLIFPNTASMNLPQMPGADQSGYAGFSDQVDHHYLATFGTAAVMSLISAGQAIGQMATFGGGASYGPYGYYQPNPMGDGQSNRRFSRLGTIRGAGSANDGAGIEPADDDRNPAGLPVRRDDHPGPRIPRPIWEVNSTIQLRKEKCNGSSQAQTGKRSDHIQAACNTQA